MDLGGDCGDERQSGQTAGLRPMKLPPQAWQALPGAGAIMAALDVAAGTSRVVGGAVRDALIGLQVSDVDLATRLQPGEVVERLEAAGLKAVPTGIDHGTITARSEEHTS